LAQRKAGEANTMSPMAEKRINSRRMLVENQQQICQKNPTDYQFTGINYKLDDILQNK
jgi:hypothetical protein